MGLFYYFHLYRTLEEYMERIEDLESGKKRLQIELDDLVSTRGTADKNVHELEKAKRALESQLAEQKTQVRIFHSLNVIAT